MRTKIVGDENILAAEATGGIHFEYIWYTPDR